MTIETTVNKTIQSGNGSNKDFDFAFEIPDEDSLSLTKRGSDGTETAITTNYTVTGIGDEAGGTVNYPTSGSALAANEKIIIKRVVALKQPENLRNQGDYSLEDIEDALDRAVMLCQQLQEQIDRCVVLNITSSQSGIKLEDLIANRLLVASADGQSIEMSSAEYGSIDTYLPTLVAIAADISTVAGISSAVSTVAGISSAVSNVSSISAAVSTVSGISANVSTVAAISANVTTVAGMSSNIASVVANMVSILNAASFGFPTLASTDARKLLRIKSTYDGYDVTDSFSNKNLAINGEFQVWERTPTSATAVSSSQYLTDKWSCILNGAMRFDCSQSSDVPTIAQAGRKFASSLYLDCTIADNSIAAGEYFCLRHVIEGYRYSAIREAQFTVSFWVKATKTGVYSISAKPSSNDASCVNEFTINAANTWEKKTITFAAPSSSNGTWNYTTGWGIEFLISLAQGSTYQTSTLNAWQNINYTASTNQVNACDSASNDFRITGFQVEKGVYATPFEERSLEQELLLTRRYCRSYGGYGSYDVVGQGSGKSTTTADIEIQLEPPMRTAPALAYSGSWQCSQRSASDAVTSMAVVSASMSNKTAVIQVTTASGLAQYRPYRLEAAASSASRLHLDADF